MVSVQERPPPLVFFKILGNVFGEKNVPGVTAIHDSLRHVNPGAGETGSFIYIDNPADWSAVDSHPKLQARIKE